jgi:cell pole-organizing protein PopZ
MSQDSKEQSTPKTDEKKKEEFDAAVEAQADENKDKGVKLQPKVVSPPTREQRRLQKKEAAKHMAKVQAQANEQKAMEDKAKVQSMQKQTSQVEAYEIDEVTIYLNDTGSSKKFSIGIPAGGTNAVCQKIVMALGYKMVRVHLNNGEILFFDGFNTIAKGKSNLPQ